MAFQVKDIEQFLLSDTFLPLQDPYFKKWKSYQFFNLELDLFLGKWFNWDLESLLMLLANWCERKYNSPALINTHDS